MHWLIAISQVNKWNVICTIILSLKNFPVQNYGNSEQVKETNRLKRKLHAVNLGFFIKTVL